MSTRGTTHYMDQSSRPANLKSYMDDDEFTDHVYNTDRNSIVHQVTHSPVKYTASFGKLTNRTEMIDMMKPIPVNSLVPKQQKFFVETACKNDGPDPYNLSARNPWIKPPTRISTKGSPSFTSPLPRFQTYSTTSDEGYQKHRNLSTQNLSERFRYFKKEGSNRQRTGNTML